MRSPATAMSLAEYRADAVLRDGTPAVIRAIRPEDRTALRDGFEHLSERTIYHRFLGAKRDLTEAELDYFTELDFLNHIALVVDVLTERGPRPIAVGRAVRTSRPAPQDRAEVAFVVADAYQGRGVGTLLLEHLVVIGRRLGYRVFEAEVLPGNRQMLDVFAHSGLRRKERIADGLVHVELELPDS